MGAVSVAVLVQAFEITGSPAAVGYLGLVQFGAMMLGVLAGSAVVDHVDRRLLLIVTQAGFGVSTTTLMIGTIVGDPPIGLLYLTSGFGSVVASLHFPTRSAMIPRVVGRAHLTAAMTLEMIVWNSTMILGPLIAGGILSSGGTTLVYGLGVVCYAVSTATMWRLGGQPPTVDGQQGRLGVAAIRHGFAYLRRHRILRAVLWIDLIAMAFGMRRSLFPILASEQFGRGPEVVGVLMAAIPAGALIVSLGGRWVEHVQRQGAGLVIAAIVWGGAVVGFGISGNRLWLGIILLAIAGGADVVAAILRSTIIQREVPAAVRGRVWGINFLVLNGGPRLGDFTGGVAASVWGAWFSVLSGGVAAIIGTALYALTVPELEHYTAVDGTSEIEDGTPSGIV